MHVKGSVVEPQNSSPADDNMRAGEAGHEMNTQELESSLQTNCKLAKDKRGICKTFGKCSNFRLDNGTNKKAH